MAICLVATFWQLRHHVLLAFSEDQATALFVLAGSVHDDQNPPQALADVTVTARDDSQRVSRDVQTDSAGFFKLQNLPAGRYTVTAERAGHAAVKFGAARFSGEGTLVVVRPGVTPPDLSLRLPRAGVIAGTVFETTGAPLPRARLRLVAVRRDAGPATVVEGETALSGPASLATTNEQGAFRLFGVAPGDYVLYVFGLTAADRAERFTYYPSALSLDAAAVIALVPGEVRTADIRMSDTPLVTVRGTVTSAGQPIVGATVLFTTSSVSTLRFGSTTIDNGTFSVAGVAPGRYNVIARWPIPRRVQGQVVHEDVVQWGEADADLSGGALDLSISIQPPPAFTGRLRTEGPPHSSAPRVALTPVVSAVLRPVLELPVEGGVFRLSDVVPGEYMVTVVGDEKGLSAWHLVSVSLGSQRLTTPFFKVNQGDRGVNVDIVVTTVTQNLTGTVENAIGATAADLSVVAFPASNVDWRAGSQRLQTTRPATDGSFVFNHLPAGGYRVAVVRSRDATGLLRETTALNALAAGSIAVTIPEGESIVQRLRMTQ